MRDRSYIRLGRLPHNPEIVMGLPLHSPVDAPPEKLDRTSLPFVPGLYGNDVLPDCTAAALANSLAAATALLNFQPAIYPALVRRFYACCVGMPADASISDLAASPGAVVADVLAFAQWSGVRLDKQVPYVPTFETIDPTARSHIAHAVATAGSAYLGVLLTARDINQFQAGEPWDDDGSDSSMPVGGHALIAWSYAGLGKTDQVLLATWGELQPATWRWLMRRLVGQEAYVPDWHLQTPD